VPACKSQNTKLLRLRFRASLSKGAAAHFQFARALLQSVHAHG
jgi:hypothetical protein